MSRSTELWRLCAAVAGMALVGGGQAEGKTMSQSMTAIDHIVDQVRSAKRIDRSLVERLAHGPLQKTGETGYFETFEASNILLGGLSLSAELRTPVAGSGATAGPLLVVRISDGCPRRTDVEARYQPWQIANIPHGRSPDEETSWSRVEPWGKLSFGFSERQPDCLSSLVFEGKEGGHHP